MSVTTSPRRAALAALAAAPLAFVALAPGAPAGAAASRSVMLKDISFIPSALSVAKGTTVTWRWNDDDTQHNVRSVVGAKRFKGSALKATGTHRVTFRTAGTYKYVCTVHPGMDGTIRVR